MILPYLFKSKMKFFFPSLWGWEWDHLGFKYKALKGLDLLSGWGGSCSRGEQGMWWGETVVWRGGGEEARRRPHDVQL